jgi:hypothetical protein
MVEHAAAINQLGKLAAQSFDTLILAEGPPQPDYVLLDLCANALFAIKQYEIGMSEQRDRRCVTEAEKAFCREIQARCNDWQLKARHDMREAGKLAATTPAGLYAKALLVKHAKSNAPVLGLSLAEDFLAMDALRSSLWPAASASA